MTEYNLSLLWKFLRIETLRGKRMIVRYVRTVGIYEGERYEKTLETDEDLKNLQKHLREMDMSVDAAVKSEGYKYAVISIEPS